MIVVVLTVGVYAAIRVVSLHQIDGALHNRHIAGVRYGTVIEFALLIVAGRVRAVDAPSAGQARRQSSERWSGLLRALRPHRDR